MKNELKGLGFGERKGEKGSWRGSKGVTANLLFEFTINLLFEFKALHLDLEICM